jgi:hypothetical protein
VQVHRNFKGKHCLELEGQAVMTNKQQGKSKQQVACVLLTVWHDLHGGTVLHSERLVTATRISDPVSWFPLLGKKLLVEPQRLLIISVFSFTSTINQVSVGMVFLQDNSIQSLTIKQMRFVNLKAVILK